MHSQETLGKLICMNTLLILVTRFPIFRGSLSYFWHGSLSSLLAFPLSYFCLCLQFTYLDAYVLSPDVESHPREQPLNFSPPATVGKVGVLAPVPQSTLMPPIWQVPPRTEKMPPLKAFQLSKELFQQRVKDNVIIVTFGNYAFMDFILTWVKHLTDLGLSNLLVGKLHLNFNFIAFLQFALTSSK